MAQIDRLLQVVIDHRASDLHLSASFPPYLRESGDMVLLEGWPVLSPDDVRSFLSEITPARNRAQYEETWDTDFAYEVTGGGRFRVNVFRDRCGMCGVLRSIPTRIPTADELALPKVVRDFCGLSKGLVLVTGPTGSGKSTTLAAMIDLINQTRADHIITIEDPIEFVHQPARCLVNQREVHTHSRSFASALRAALREDPNIVLVGEMRDLETMETAIETASTGHLVFGTLHTNTAPATVDRIIEKYPADRQSQVRSMLAEALRGVIAQTLCRRRDGGRVAAQEVLVITSGIASMIREGKTHQISSAMQTGRGVGMQTLNDALFKLVQDGMISTAEAYARAIEKDTFGRMVTSSGLYLDIPADAAPLEAACPDAASAQESSVPMEETLQHLRKTLEHSPDNADTLNNLAWILATIAKPGLRDIPEAVQAAEKAYALTEGRNLAIIDTLGAVYAEAGHFDKAIALARKGLKLARATDQAVLAEALEKHLRTYEEHRPLPHA